ncbi:sugar transferase [Cloacibacillus evryensis]|uniref:sugar transferase n=1 Tax=Cloacibacillus evryensis TaxID=508460 RepID=UPI00241C93FD|nr:sugar transferase [Cloacibacillus evryensis]
MPIIASRSIQSNGKFLCKTVIDELPQILCIFTGQMSVIGPRPALWNQYDLIAERDKYGANDILAGWTQEYEYTNKLCLTVGKPA